jgi:membrane carboxypeptidase/penicillin-binding protein
LFAVGTVVFLVGVAGVAALIWHFSQDLPDYSQLQNYEPPVMTRVHAADGSLLAYQITSMMEGVVQGGTAAIMRDVGKPIAGKTGTTNEAKDLWFVGFSPDLVVGLYVGYDKPRSLGRTAQAGHTAAPIARDFMKLALADNRPFRSGFPPASG